MACTRSPIDPPPRPPMSRLAVPRLIPSRDVPEMAVVGKPRDQGRRRRVWPRAIRPSPTTSSCGACSVAKVLRSPHAHARIVDIDDSKALALPGVHAVIKHYKNTPRIMYASGGQSGPTRTRTTKCSFDNKVRHVGDRVAAVAAETPELAAEACRLIKVTYDVLPVVFDEREAMAEARPSSTTSTTPSASTMPHATSALHIKADVTDERRSRVRIGRPGLRAHLPSAPGAADPHRAAHLGGMARRRRAPGHPHRDAGPVPCTAHASPRCSGCEIKDIRVIKPRIGGGFGAKQEMLIEDIVGHLALATQSTGAARARPGGGVRVLPHPSSPDAHVSHRRRQARHPRGPGTAHHRQHRRVRHPRLTVQTVTGLRGLSSYNCPNKKFDCDVVYTNIPVPGAYRGYGAPQAEFALECHMEDIARALGLDVIDFKRQNWVKVGDELDIAPHPRRAGASRARRASTNIPGVMSQGIEECVAQANGPSAGTVGTIPSGSPRRSSAHPAGYRLRVLHARHRHPLPRHGRVQHQDERRRLVQRVDRRPPTSAPVPTPCSARSRPRSWACPSTTSSCTRPTPT